MKSDGDNPNDSSKDATKQSSNYGTNIVLGSEATVDQILANEANNQQKVWTDQFLEEGDEYVSSMNL